MPLVSNIGRSIPIVERLASVVRGATGRGKRQEAHAGHPFGADLYCGHETFGGGHYCRKQPFGGDLYLNVDSDLLS